MVDFVEQIRVWTEQVILWLGYPGIALLMLAENLFPPIPSEVIMPFAGFLAADGRFNLVGVTLAGATGSVLGALALYYVGRWADEALLRNVVRRYGWLLQLSENDLERALRGFDRYGEAIVLVGRVITLVRSLVSIPAGMRRMPLPRFLLLTALGSLVWSGLLAYVGMKLGERWADILTYLGRYEQLIQGVLVVLVIVWLARLLLRRRAARRGAEPAPTHNSIP